MLCPDQHVFLVGPDQPFHQKEQKDQHSDGFSDAKTGKSYGKWQKKDGFYVKNEKNDAVKVVAGLELDPSVTFRFQPALIDGILAGTGLVRRVLFGPDPCEQQGRQSERDGRQQQDNDRQIQAVGHSFWLLL